MTRRHGVRLVAEVGLAAATLALLAVAIDREGGRLGRAVGGLAHLRWGWVLLAVAAESGSMATFARLQRRVLQAGGGRLALRSALAIGYAGNAISVGVPLAGPGLGTAFTLQQLDRHGIDRAVATTALVVSGILSTVTLTAIVAVAAVASGDPVAGAAGAGTAVALLAAVGVATAAARSDRWRERCLRLAAGCLRVGRRLARRPAIDARQAVADAVRRASTLRLDRTALGWAAAFAACNWLLDLGCFVAATRAAGLGTGPARLALAWSAGSAVGGLGVTPGGIGVIEAGLIAALVAAGAAAVPAATAVVTYRLISLLLVVAVGAALLVVLRHQPAAGAG